MKYYKFLLIMIVVFSSCKVYKTNAVLDKTIKKISTKKLIKKINKASFNSNSLEAKYKVNFNDGKKDQRFTVQLKLDRDSVIWLKGSKLVTVFKAVLTADKVAYYSSIFKNYFEGDYKILTDVFGVKVRFEELQNILLGQSITTFGKDDAKLTIQNNAYELLLNDTFNSFNVSYGINGTHFKLNQQRLVNTSKGQQLEINYPSYTSASGELLPSKIEIIATQGSRVNKITMSLKSIEINKNINTSFSIPKGYKKVSL